MWYVVVVFKSLYFSEIHSEIFIDEMIQSQNNPVGAVGIDEIRMAMTELFSLSL